MSGENGHTRRAFLKGCAGATGAAAALAGCLTLGGGRDTRRVVPGLYDLGSPVSAVREPLALGVRDAFTHVNVNDLAPWWIDHEWVDPALGYNTLQQFPSDYDPPAVVGYDTAKTGLLAPRVTRREIVFLSASYRADLHEPATPYNFFTNLDYTTQARVHLRWVARTDPGATVAFVYPDNRFGRSPVAGGRQYARSLGLDVGDDIPLPLGATSAESHLQAARRNGVDYLVVHNNARAMQALMRDKRAVHPEATVCGLTWTVDEWRVRQAPDAFEGARYVNASKTFGEVVTGDTRGRSAVETAYDRAGRSLDDETVANLHYVRGFVQALVLVRAFGHAAEMGLDIFAGEDLREGMLAVDGWDAWGLSEPLTFEQGDRRATTAGRLYEVADGELVHDTTVELPRKDEWLGL